MTTRPTPERDPASFRDPAGSVHHVDGRIIRAVSPRGVAAFRAAWEKGIYQELAAEERMIATTLLPASDPLYAIFDDAALLAEHPRLPCITYPYEWPFEALRRAALAHLDLQLALLAKGFTLSDASAFNMQFNGFEPVHIDALSVIPYEEGMLWNAQRQFQRQFLNPLLFTAYTGIAFNAFYRATLDGMSSSDLLRLLPMKALLRPSTLLHVALPGMAERHAGKSEGRIPSPLPRHRFKGMLSHLRMIIKTLECPARSHWTGYAATTSYSEDDAALKKSLVRTFTSTHRPALLLDAGCNTGDMAAMALEAGACKVIGLESDPAAANAAFERSSKEHLDVLPLVMDMADPSPAQGWRSRERTGLYDRLRPDALVALALLHHLTLGKNIPLPEALAMLIGIAPRGLIEFVPNTDPQAARLIRGREQLFTGHTIEAARTSIAQQARIVNETIIGTSGRTLFEYERHP